MASTIENIYSKSFPGQNVLDFSLVKDTTPDLPFYKPRYFCFISVMPGVKTESGGRTFNREGRITIKAELDKVLALSNSVRAFARGQGQKFGQFAIFADSSKSGYGASGGIKSCFASEFTQQGKDGKPKNLISVSMKASGNPIGNFMTASEAMALAHILEFIANEGLKLDFEARKNSVGTVQNNNPKPQQGYNQNQGGYNQNQNQNQGGGYNHQPQNQQQGFQGNSATQNAMNPSTQDTGQPNGYVAPPDDDIPF